MARRIAVTNLNASSVDIINTIRANADPEYQSLVPEIDKTEDIPKVGEVLYGYPAIANKFLSALVNRIALVRINSATFNNRFSPLKKGMLEYGETVEEVFVGLCKAREFSAEKAAAREFKRTIPDVRSAFHSMNWRVQYPITVTQEELRTAFMSASGVTDLIAKIIQSVYTSAEYDEFLLFKYLIIKGVTHGKMFAKGVDLSDFRNASVAFRATSNELEFMSNKYNAYGVTTTTPKADQYIFMGAEFNARFDTMVLASAFNMDKATFMGKLNLIDNFTTFDNTRFSEILENSTQIEPVTDDELALMANVKAIIVDKEWFQVYDNLTVMTDTKVASGLYYNYFYNVWKTVSSSPFSNAIVFLDTSADMTMPSSFTVSVESKASNEHASIYTLHVDDDNPALHNTNAVFIQDEDATESGIAVHRYGAYIVPTGATPVNAKMVVNGITYVASSKIGPDTAEGATFTFQKTV